MTLSYFRAYQNKIDRIIAGVGKYKATSPSYIGTSSSSFLKSHDNSIDYIFTDPPFGDNFPYAELNFQVESWHKVITNMTPEAVVDRSKKNKNIQKSIKDYSGLMLSCFSEYYRILKPGRWMTVVFHNSKNAVWNSIQDSLQSAGFIVADVRTLDKKQGSFKQVTSVAVKQDLVISAYKPNGGLEERFEMDAGTEEGAWGFVRTHLRQLPVFVVKGDEMEPVAERMGYYLFDRMVAFHVQRGVRVPLSSAEFHLGLNQRFAERDSMFFLQEQIPQYDKKRLTASQIKQLTLDVVDEASAIEWLRQQLKSKPQGYQEIQPQFMERTRAGWLKYEIMPELSELLEMNFLPYSGQGAVPSQIHSYLSTNFKDLRGLSKQDPILQDRAKDRWYVPDPNKASDLEKLRERALLREFESYRESPQKRLKRFRLEAVRTGFKKAWGEKDFTTIVDVAAKIPDTILQEGAKLLMWYDQAVMKVDSE